MFAPVPKSMALMDEQPFSQVFRRRYPTFNGLTWAYHWLQVGLYEPLARTVGAPAAEREAAVHAVVERFRAMVRRAPDGYPEMMPMTIAIAPTFSAAHPRAAAIFDNLHMAHDIISDVLADDAIPRARKPAEIERQMRLLADRTTDVIGIDEWRAMAESMGVDMMGGAAWPPPGEARP